MHLAGHRRRRAREARMHRHLCAKNSRRPHLRAGRPLQVPDEGPAVVPRSANVLRRRRRQAERIHRRRVLRQRERLPRAPCVQDHDAVGGCSQCCEVAGVLPVPAHAQQGGWWVPRALVEACCLVGRPARQQASAHSSGSYERTASKCSGVWSGHHCATQPAGGMASEHCARP